MRFVVLVLLAAGSCAFAQHRGGFGSVLSPGTGAVPSRPTNPSGFGSVLSPGTGVPPGSQRSGFGRGFFAPPGIAHPRHDRTVVVPYPVYYGGYYGYDPSANGYAQPAPGYDAD